MLRTLALFVENNPGVLARISALFSGKGYNLESLTAGITTDPLITRITIVCKSDDIEFEQIKKQLNRLIEVLKVIDLSSEAIVNKEMAFIKVGAKVNQRSEIFQVAQVFNSRISNVDKNSIIIEISDTSKRIDEFLVVLNSYNIIEIARSGIIAMKCG